MHHPASQSPQDVGDHTNGPDVHRRPINLSFHDLGGKIARSSAGGRQSVHGVRLVMSLHQDDLASEPKVGDFDVRVVRLVLQ